MIGLSGCLVIVTGGNSGIGLGVARGVARAGAFDHGRHLLTRARAE